VKFTDEPPKKLTKDMGIVDLVVTGKMLDFVSTPVPTIRRTKIRRQKIRR
jgi:hypothetical protein